MAHALSAANDYREMIEGSLDNDFTAQKLGKDMAKDRPRIASKWLSSDELALLAKVADRNARRAMLNHRWHGCELVVRQVAAPVGRGGKILQVHVDSLPVEMREKWYLDRGIDPNAKAEARALIVSNDDLAHDPAFERGRKKAAWKLAIIRPILQTKVQSAARGEMIEQIAKTGVVKPNGALRKITKQTLYNWVNAYEANGLYGLVRKKKSDSGSRRVDVTRAWDGFFALAARTNEAQRVQIGAEIRHYVRGLWAAGAAGWRAVSEQSTTRLIELSHDLGVDAFEAWPLGKPSDVGRHKSRFGICHINRRACDRERRFAQIAIKTRDNAAWQDKYAPTIRRDYSQLKPREIVVGDVHPVDIMMRRADGSPVYPKAISWLDPATNEMHMTFALLAKGEGIRREHVAMSFEAMVGEWGLPRLLYLDNGSEYKWQEMIGGFTLLSKLSGQLSVFDLDSDTAVSGRVARAREAVIRSTAYNAKGKPKIEGAFGNIEQVFFSTIKGWTAGGRMNKKTHLKGRDPHSFDGDEHDFLDTAAKALEWYHKRPQYGWLDGRSPNEMLAGHVDKGWGKTILKRPEVLALAFATTETRKVDRGCVSYTPRGQSARRYYHDALLAYGHQSITIRVPAYKPDYVFCFDGDELICIATPEQQYHPLDPAGAQEVSRRKKILGRHISEQRKHCALLSLTDELARHVEHLPDAPEVPVAAELDVAMLERMAALEDRTREALAQAAPKTREFDQWGVRDDDDPFLKNFKFSDEEQAGG